MNGYPSTPDLRISPRLVTPDKSSIHLNQNILDPLAISPSFFDQETCPSQDADLDTSDMDFMSDVMTAVDAAIEAGILNAMGDGTSFSNDNLGLEGFDAAFSSASITNSGFPSLQPASQISSPFVDHLDIHQLYGYPPEDITSWLLGEQHQNPSASGVGRGFPSSPTLIITDADQEQKSTAFPFTSRLRRQSFSSARELCESLSINFSH